MRDIETIDSELRLATTLRRAARERGGPLPSIDMADALLDERRRLNAAAPHPASWLVPVSCAVPADNHANQSNAPESIPEKGATHEEGLEQVVQSTKAFQVRHVAGAAVAVDVDLHDHFAGR